MIDQEILDNVPDWAVVVFETDSIDEAGVAAMGELLRVLKPRSLADIKRIVELEGFNVGLAEESCAQQKRIAELEKYFNSACVDVLNNRGKVVTESTLIHIRGAIDKFNLPLDIKTLKEQVK